MKVITIHYSDKCMQIIRPTAAFDKTTNVKDLVDSIARSNYQKFTVKTI